MKFHLRFDRRITSIIKDILFIVIAFILFVFIDVNLAKYVALFCTSILLIRRIIIDLNPLHGQKMHVVYNGKQLSLPENVEIFELNDSASFETLWRYAGALKFISTPPKILIVRFIQQIHIDKASAQIICEVVKHLSEIKVRVIFVDVNNSTHNQLVFHNINDIIGDENFFSSIDKALKACRK